MIVPSPSSRSSVAGLALAALALPAVAADACKNRGELDTMYCDDNKDMVADVPADPKKWKNPSTIVFTYTPVEDPAVYENIFKPFTTHLRRASTRRSCSTRCSRMPPRSRRCARGACTSAVSRPVRRRSPSTSPARCRSRSRATTKEFQGYNLIVIVKANSPYQKLADLKGKKVAHTSPSSNSGHLAPLSLFPAQGLFPDKDYKIIFSGKHDQSVMGVNSGDYDAGGGRLRRLPPDGRARAGQGERLPRDLPQPEVPDVVVRLCARPRSEARRQDAGLLLRLSFPARNGRRPSTAPTASSRSTTRRPGKSCARSPRVRARRSTRPRTRRSRRARPPKPRRRNSRSFSMRGARRPVSFLRHAHAEEPLQVLRRRHAGAAGRRRRDRRARHHGDHRRVGHGQVDADPLHQPAGRADAGEILFEGADLATTLRARRCGVRAGTSAWCSRSTTWSSGSP